VDIDVKIDRQKKKKKKEPDAVTPREVWPTMLEEELPLAFETTISFFDAMTKLDEDGNWIDVPEWSNDWFDPSEEETERDGNINLKERMSFTKEGRDYMPFMVCPKDTEYKIYTNLDSRADPDCIENEYGPSNLKRWERKPFATLAVDWMLPGNRFRLGGMYEILTGAYPGYAQKTDMSMMNIQCNLKKGKDAEPYATVDPASSHMKQSKILSMSYPYNVDIVRPLKYTGFLGGAYGIEVKDLSKSFGHYLSGSIDYTYDWIEGAFFCPFDTTDIDPSDGKYKITKEPSYDAEAVSSGLIVDDDKFDVFMVPRRIAYHLYYRHHVLSGTTIDSSLSGDCDCDWWGRAWRSTGGNEAYDCGYDQVDCCDDSPPCGGGTGTFHAKVVQSTHYVGLWWGRLPHDFTPHNLRVTDDANDSHYPTAVHNKSTISFFNDSNDSAGTKDLIWEETYDDAREHAEAAGVSREEIDKIWSGGGSSLHVVGETTPHYIRCGNASTPNLWHLDAVKNTMFLSVPFMRAEDDFAYNGWQFTHENASLGIKRLWVNIADSDYYQNVIGPLRDSAAGTTGAMQSSRVDCIPYGIAISPSKAGSLVGIVRKGTGGNCWFIWRAKDENFEEEGQLKTVGTAGKGRLSFQSRSDDGSLSIYSEGPYDYTDPGKSYLYDIDGTDQFSGPSGSGRKLTAMGRNIEYTAGDSGDDCPSVTYCTCACSGEGQITLDVPIYVAASKEWGMYDLPYSAWGYGAHASLRSRICRHTGPYVDPWYRNYF
jgi:hypothetical protein